MMSRSAFLLVPLLAAALAACGGDDKPAPASIPTSRVPALTTAAALKSPPLARTALTTGELIFTGPAAPGTHGSFALDGTYIVRFEQFDPDDEDRDFSRAAPLTVGLRPASSMDPGFELFAAKEASGQRELTRKGRFALDVTRGDFPYAVRFTPQQ